MYCFMAPNTSLDFIMIEYKNYSLLLSSYMIDLSPDLMNSLM